MFIIAMIPPIVLLFLWGNMKQNHYDIFNTINIGVQKEHGKTIFEYTENQSNGIFSFPIITIVSASSPIGLMGGQTNDLAFTFIVITFITWAFCRRYMRVLSYLTPIITSKQAEEKLDGMKSQSSKQQRNPQYDDFADSGASNDAFGFDAGRFGAKPPPPPPQPDENAPRGYDKRHPDDAKLWAIVDDPDASDGERRNAMDMILKRQARRRGGNGGGGGGQEDPEKQSGRTNLLGSKRRS